MMARPNRCSLFDLVDDPKLNDGLREILNVQNHPGTISLAIREESPDDKRGTENRRDDAVPLGEVSDRKFCSACRCSFESREEQTEHYKLDWHRFNLRQRLAGRSPITVEEFEKKTGMGDVSSISGSDSEDEESNSEDDSGGGDGAISYGGRLPSRVWLQNSHGQYFCPYRCAVQKSTLDGDTNFVDSLLNISEKTMWLILMTGGGHFAGAVYKGKEVLQHKTFHRYTVRAKRGMAQSVRDAQNRTQAPKSAGATLRRYNEAALTKGIQELLKSWAEYLMQADVIFLRTPKYNRSVFFGGRGAPLEKKDSRLRSIPFATRRATFSEIKRVHDVLSMLQIYDKTSDIPSILSSTKKMWQKKKSNSAACHVDQQQDDQEEEDEVSVQLHTDEVTLTTLDLREHEFKPGKKKRKKRKEKPIEREDLKDEMEDKAAGDKKTKGTKNLNKNQHDEEDKVCASYELRNRDALYTTCKTGDVQKLQTLLMQDTNMLTQILSTPIDSAGLTLLHVASASAQKCAINLLLEMGSDPTCRNKKGQTPYVVAANRECRTIFKKFMAEHPDKYDYAEAQIPGPVMERKKAEKKAAQRAAKKQREKELREAKQRDEEEQAEKMRFLALDDREKRALAAERRLAEQLAAMGRTIPNVRRCCQCGESLLGKVPYEYQNYCFCSTRCVQIHRKDNLPAKP